MDETAQRLREAGLQKVKGDNGGEREREKRDIGGFAGVRSRTRAACLCVGSLPPTPRELEQEQRPVILSGRGCV